MIIRFIVENLFSFDKAQEFNMLPSGYKKSMKHHVIEFDSIGVLKLSAIYGANGAGKSNLIKAISHLQRLVLGKITSKELHKNIFKLKEFNVDKKQLLAVEFYEQDKSFLYALEIEKGIILTEELYLIEQKDKKEILLFERKAKSEKSISLKFNADFENDDKNFMLKAVLEEDFINPYKPIFDYLINRGDSYFNDIRKAYNWFKESLNIIYPSSTNIGLVLKIEKDKRFAKYIEQTMCALDIGIKSIEIKRNEVDLDSLSPENREKFNDNDVRGLMINPTLLDVFEKEDDGKVYHKSLAISHSGENNYQNSFSLDEESDGTKRLLHILPVIDEIANKRKVFFIDEIERSIHPSLIKKLIRKYSDDKSSKGQLIFTTHESNLLDQTIFSQDEIWFAEKDKSGSTSFITLNDFKEHRTIDIRKGYLNGRYGGIPFLGNFEELHWGINVDNE
ncbi:ATP-binding protein [bacterium]|nr:ATP-binding protein [bacterium]